MSSNSNRILNELISLDAWYTGFSEQCSESELFMEVRFQEAMFGGRKEDTVRFKVVLRNAEVVVIAEDPIMVPRGSILRSKINIEGETIEQDQEETGTNLAGGMETSADLSGGHLKIASKAIANRSKKKGSSSTMKVKHSGFFVEHSTDSDKNDRWSFSPAIGEFLKGHGFPETKPLMKMKLENYRSAIPPVVKVLVRCRRQDIEILEIEPKDPSLLEKHVGIGKERKKRLAAEIIKDALVDQELHFEDFDEDYSLVVVADVIAKDE